MPSRRALAALVVAAASACPSATGAVEIAPLVIYLAPQGSDAADGSTRAAAVATLGRVHDLVSGLPADFNRDVVVAIAAGDYSDQTVRWTKVIPGRSITFEPADGRDAMPRFDGRGLRAPVWFELVYDDGPSRLRFHHIRVENYMTAIAFDGGSYLRKPGNGSNEIYDVRFEHVGGITNGVEGYGVVHLVNSSDNRISNSHFIWMAPPPQTKQSTSCNGFHVIYAADRSSRNDINGNWFEDVCAEPVIKFRNGSNDNAVAGNRFLHTGANTTGASSLVGSMHTLDLPDNRPGECPPIGNRVFYNEYCGGFVDQLVEMAWDSGRGYPPPEQQVCEVEDMDRRPRMRTYGNKDGKSSPIPWCRPLAASEISRRQRLWPW